MSMPSFLKPTGQNSFQSKLQNLITCREFVDRNFFPHPLNLKFHHHLWVSLYKWQYVHWTHTNPLPFSLHPADAEISPSASLPHF